ncbi:hydantoinase/oxoprolinase family protein [Actinomadura luteofluorescens]
MASRVAVDVGGTFTDVCVLGEHGEAPRVAKVPTTAGSPIDGVMRGIARAGADLADTWFFCHGTTVATNALLNRTFPRAALVTTRGFRDVIEIRRGTKEDLWDAYRDVAPPYIARRDRLVVTERVDATGRVIEPLDMREARELVETLRRRQVRTVAVCFVNSYVNPVHEIAMMEFLRAELPDVAVSVSSAVLDEILEHERFSTTVANALLSPLIGHYAASLEQRLAESGYAGRLHLMHGGGGVMTTQAAQRHAARLASSGLAAGAVASRHIALACGYENSLGLDIGGTSADISMVSGGELKITRNWSVDFGHPICFPNLEVLTIGAGGGSMAWVDDGGALRVGPQSAGADPGPACYGLGGTAATTTDAQLVLGQIDTSLAAGSQILDVELARRAVRRIAKELSCSLEDAAVGILRVASANLADALKIVSIRRGQDPRDFALVAFGGAGPMHAVHLARELSLPAVVIPPHPGVTSAFGCLLVDIRHDSSAMFIREAHAADPYEIESTFLRLESHARKSLLDDGVETERISMQRFIEMRYRGQSRSMPIAVDQPVRAIDGLVEKFHVQHRGEFGFSRDHSDVDLFQLSVSALGVIDRPRFGVAGRGNGRPVEPVGRRMVRFVEPRCRLETPVYDRSDLYPGVEVTGPAVIAQPDATTLIPPDWTALVDPMENLRISMNADR